MRGFLFMPVTLSTQSSPSINGVTLLASPPHPWCAILSRTSATTLRSFSVALLAFIAGHPVRHPARSRRSRTAH